MPETTVKVEITPRAESRLKGQDSPLAVEMEIYFSCLIRLRVLFPETIKKDYISVASDNSKLKLYFNPVMTSHCNIEDVRGREPDTEYFPIQKPEKFIPKWLKLDFKNNQWQGKFGY